MNQASSRTRTWPSRSPSKRSRKRALLSLPRLAPRRTSRSISGTAPTFQSRSTTAARHSQPWPRRKRGRLGLAVWLWWIREPGARAEIRSTTVSSITTYRIVDHDVPDGRREQSRQDPRQRPPDRQPSPATILEEPVVGCPGPRQPGRQDRVGDVTAAYRGGADQQLGESRTGARRHGDGEGADEGGQQRRGWGGGGGRSC